MQRIAGPQCQRLIVRKLLNPDPAVFDPLADKLSLHAEQSLRRGPRYTVQLVEETVLMATNLIALASNLIAMASNLMSTNRQKIACMILHGCCQ